MSDWLSELRYSLEASFEAIWQQFDSDGNGELDTHELDHLVAEMLKVSGLRRLYLVKCTGLHDKQV